MSLFKNLRNVFKGDASVKSQAAPSNQQAVLIHLDGTSLPDEVYRDYDVSSLEDLMTERIESSGAGELDGHETGPEIATIYLYGRDAEALFAAVEPVLSNFPLCQKVKVSIRRGGPGSPAREVVIEG